jgi:drug/metabolite transporter (DMT)-like permease
MKGSEIQALDWGILFLLGLIWGSSFILIKWGLIGFTPYQLAAIRISISAVCLSPFLIKHLKKVKKHEWLPIVMAGILGNGIPPFLFAIAETTVSSSVAGVINTTTPLFAFLIGILFFSVSIRWTKLLGIFIGLIGALILILYGSQNPGMAEYRHGSIILIATFLYGTSVNVVKRYLQHTHPLTITSVSFIFTGIPALIYLFSTDFTNRMTMYDASRESFIYIAILSLLGTAFGSIVFYKLTQSTTALFASTVTYIIPVIAILWGLSDQEYFTPVHILGLLFILGGVFLSGAGNRKKIVVKI